VYFSY